MDNLTKALIICLIVFYLISMKMVKSDALFVTEKGKRKFSIVAELEFPKSKESIKALLTDIDSNVRETITRQLNDDYIFMAAAYIGTALMCLIARNLSSNDSWRCFFLVMACLQILPWVFDIIENGVIKNWVKGFETDVNYKIKTNLGLYKAMVYAKFFIAGIAALASIGFFLTFGWCR